PPRRRTSSTKACQPNPKQSAMAQRPNCSSPVSRSSSGPVTRVRCCADTTGRWVIASVIGAVAPQIFVLPVSPAAGAKVTIRGMCTTGHSAGTTDFPPDPCDLEQLTVQGVQATVAPRGAGGSGTWSVALTFPAPGDVTLSATIKVLDASHHRHIATLSGKVTVARPPLALTVVS